MSKYTTEVRFICESLAGELESQGNSKVKEIIENARVKIFDFDYPIYDSEYKGVLETKILRHFYTREIGAETYGLWKMWLETKMNEIMPYYNQLYKSTLLDFNPLYDVDVTTTRTIVGDSKKTDSSISAEHNEGRDSTTGTEDTRNSRTVTGSKEDTRTGKGTTGATTSTVNDSTAVENGNDWRYFSDTPEGGLTNIDTTGNLKYLTDLTHNTQHNDKNNRDVGSGSSTGQYDDSETNSGKFTNVDVDNALKSSDSSRNNSSDKTGSSTLNSNVNTTEAYSERVFGKRSGDYSEMLIKFRQTMLNIDMQIVDELEDLFMQLW